MNLVALRGSIDGMKLSVSLPDEDVRFLDHYAATRGAGSRSAALQQAIGMLRAAELEDAYRDAWAEWEGAGEAAAWAPTTGDGILHAAG
jgi:Arc/MetJ-type ribon-helix-helix transcriptional regulator